MFEPVGVAHSVLILNIKKEKTEVKVGRNGVAVNLASSPSSYILNLKRSAFYFSW